MSCFWTGILKSFDLDDFKFLGFETTSSPVELARLVKGRNRMTPGVRCATSPEKAVGLSLYQQEENLDEINSYDPETAARWRDSGFCDPFLVLISQVLQVNVDFLYQNKHRINLTVLNPRKTLKFSCSRHHFVKV